MLVRIIFLLFVLTTNFCHAQTSIDTIQPFDKLPNEFLDKLSGVKYANMYEGEAYVQALVNNQNSLDAQLLMGFVEFLRDDFGYLVAITQEQVDELQGVSESLCQYTKVRFTGSFDSDVMAVGSIVGVMATFRFCDGSIYVVKIEDYGVSGMTKHWKKIQKEFRRRFPYPIPYDDTKELSFEELEIVISESEILEVLKTDLTRSPFEGVYQFFSGPESGVEKLAIYRHEEKLSIIFISGSGNYSNDWREGELKGTLTPTKSPTDFLVKLFLSNKQEANGSLSFDENAFTLNVNGQNYRFIKL